MRLGVSLYCRVIVEYHSSNVVCSCRSRPYRVCRIGSVTVASVLVRTRPRPESALKTLKLRTRPARGRPPHPPRLPSVRVRAPGEGVRLGLRPAAAPRGAAGRPGPGMAVGSGPPGPRLKVRIAHADCRQRGFRVLLLAGAAPGVYNATGAVRDCATTSTTRNSNYRRTPMYSNSSR